MPPLSKSNLAENAQLRKNRRDSRVTPISRCDPAAHDGRKRSIPGVKFADCMRAHGVATFPIQARPAAA